MAPCAGLLVRRGGERLFLSARIARHLVLVPRLTRIPWDSAQMALVGGEVLAVVELGEPSGVLVVCELDGQALALSGLFAEKVGVWPGTEAGVSVDGVNVPALDLGAALEQFQRNGQTPKDGAA
jgi:hypothetical protein